MTYKEAYEEIKSEFDEFLTGCHLTSKEQIQAEISKNDDFRVVYEANMLALKALEILEKIFTTESITQTFKENKE